MELASIRDIAVVLLATVMLVTTMVLVITGVFVWRLIAAIREDIAPISELSVKPLTVCATPWIPLGIPLKKAPNLQQASSDLHRHCSE